MTTLIPIYLWGVLYFPGLGKDFLYELCAGFIYGKRYGLIAEWSYRERIDPDDTSAFEQISLGITNNTGSKQNIKLKKSELANLFFETYVALSQSVFLGFNLEFPLYEEKSLELGFGLGIGQVNKLYNIHSQSGWSSYELAYLKFKTPIYYNKHFLTYGLGYKISDITSHFSDGWHNKMEKRTNKETTTKALL